MTPTPDDRPSSDEDDRDAALRRRLRALPPEPGTADPVAEAALRQRVLAAWAAAHPAARPVPVGTAAAVGAADGAAASGGRPAAGGSPQAWRLLVAALVACAAVAAWTGLARPDPTVEELMRLDVLSQIAGGAL